MSLTATVVTFLSLPIAALIGLCIESVIRGCFNEREDSVDNSDPPGDGWGDPGDLGGAHDPLISSSRADGKANPDSGRGILFRFPTSEYKCGNTTRNASGWSYNSSWSSSASDPSQRSAVKFPQETLHGVLDEPIRASGGQHAVPQQVPAFPSSKTAVKIQPGAPPADLDMRMTARGAPTSTLPHSAVKLDASPNSAVKIDHRALPKALNVPISPSGGLTTATLQVRLDPSTESIVKHKQGVSSHSYKHTTDPLPFVKEPSSGRRIGHYLSSQKILLVGEGDFSFSNALARAFGSAQNMVPTSLDTEETVLGQYKTGSQNLCSLKSKGALVLHGVNATCMAKHKILGGKSFDCIIYNFPHAGFHGPEDDNRMIRCHKHLVRHFFCNASKLLRRSGEIHVVHQARNPYSKWNLEEQAASSGLVLKECCDFDKKHYPGYVNRRGGGPFCGQTFYVKECKTFKFILSPSWESSCLQTKLVKGQVSQYLEKDTYKIEQHVT